MTSTEVKFEAHNKLVRDVLFWHEHFRIPDYQRPYSWTIDNVNDFWDDLENNDTGYFIWSFVLNYENYSTNHYVDIIDWQQRILTITIFLSVIRDIAKLYDEQPFTELVNLIQNEYIWKYDPIDDIQTYRVITGESTKDFFEKYIQSWEYILKSEIWSLWRLVKEHKSIRDNYMFLYEKIIITLDWKTALSDKLQYLKNLIKKLRELSVIWIKIEKEIDAYVIFETVNDRWVDLSAADLVKNKIFHYHDKKFWTVIDAKEWWGIILDNLEWIDDVNSFLKYYLSSKYWYVSKKWILKKIQEKIVDYKIFLEDLKIASLHYRIILNAQDTSSFDIWSSSDISIANDKRNECYLSTMWLQSMRVKQFAIVILSLLRNRNVINKYAKPNRVFHSMEKFAFNFFTLAKMPGRDIEVLCCTTAVNIDSIASKTLTQEEWTRDLNRIFDNFINKLKGILPDSTDILYEWFMEINYKNRELCRYALTKINRYIQPNAEIDYNSVNLEHILPQNPSSEWNLTINDIKNYVHMLWNLTILWSIINKQIWNKTLDQKLPEIEQKSVLKVAQDLVKKIKDNNLSWSKEDIVERHKDLASLAIEQVWKLK